MQIDFQIVDDLNVSVDPDTYQDAGNPPPPPAGNYKIMVDKWAIRRTQDGEVILDNNENGTPAFPRIVLEMVKIVEPFPFNDRKVGIYQDFRTKPFNREGSLATNLGDMVRALDATRSFSGLKQGLEVFDELVQTNPMSVYADWVWYDSEFVTAKMDEEFDGRNYGELSPDEKKLAGGIYNAAKLQGMKRNKLPNGKYSHIWTNPASGNKVEARWKIVKFMNSLASVRYYVVEN